MRSQPDTERILERRLRGYHRTFRGKFLLLISKSLSQQEYILWDFSFSILADWDYEKHPEIFGTFDYSLATIEKMLGWGKSKASRLSKKLFKLGLWEMTESGRIHVMGLEILQNLTAITKEEGVVDLQSYLVKMRRGDVKIQQPETKEIKEIQPQTAVNLQHGPPRSYLDLSYKGNSNKFVHRTDEGYGQILQNGNHAPLEIDDQRWIDENV